MRNPTDEILAAAKAELDAGATMKAVLSTPRNKDGETLSYGQFWCYNRRFAVVGTPADIKGIATPDAIVEQRNQGISWGDIAVNADLPESRVRKLFSEATGVRSQGLRIGAGGRYLTDDQVFYTGGEARVTGTAIPTDVPLAKVKDQLLSDLRKASVAAKAKADKVEARKAAAAAKKAKVSA